MKATILTDNIENGSLKGEWGLSVYIEYGDKKILLDTGASELFAENAKKLELPLCGVDYAVLSHAHYDHADGMERFFAENDKASFYLQKSCLENCYFKKWIIRKYIGIKKGMLKNTEPRLIYVSGDMELCPGVSLIAHRTQGLSAVGIRENMYRKTPDGFKPDDFSHEQSLVFDTEKGLVVFSSCSHGGAVNIINEIGEAFPDKKVYALIGGLHVFNKPDDEVRALADRIRQTGIEYIFTGHCTGDKQYKILKKELGDCVHQFKAGLVMEF